MKIFLATDGGGWKAIFAAYFAKATKAEKGYEGQAGFLECGGLPPPVV